MSDMPEVADKPNDDRDDEAWEMSSTVRKLNNSFTGMPHPLTVSWTWSGRTNNHDASKIALYSANHGGSPAHYPDPEPTTISKVRESPE